MPEEQKKQNGWKVKYYRYFTLYEEDGYESADAAIKDMEDGVEFELLSSVSITSPDGVEYFDPDRTMTNDPLEPTWDVLRNRSKHERF